MEVISVVHLCQQVDTTHHCSPDNDRLNELFKHKNNNNNKKDFHLALTIARRRDDYEEDFRPEYDTFSILNFFFLFRPEELSTKLYIYIYNCES